MKVKTFIKELQEYDGDEDIIVICWDKSSFDWYMQDLVDEGLVARDVAEKYHKWLWAQVVEECELDLYIDEGATQALNEIMADTVSKFKDGPDHWRIK